MSGFVFGCKMKDAVWIAAGGLLLAFEKKEQCGQMARHNAKGMNDANDWFVFVATMAILSALRVDRNSSINALVQCRIVEFFRLAGVRILCVGGGTRKDLRWRVEGGGWRMHLILKLHKCL